VKLQWRKWGDYVRTWRSSPTFLDGFASSRFLAVHGERRSIVAQQTLSFAKITDIGSWHTVGDKILKFELESTTTVLFSYGLPVTQMSSPTLDEWTLSGGQRSVPVSWSIQLPTPTVEIRSRETLRCTTK